MTEQQQIRRILMVQSSGGLHLYFFTTFLISASETHYSYQGQITRDRLIGDHGEAGTQLFLRVDDIPGIKEVSMSEYQLTVERLPAMKWREIRPHVISALRFVHGDFDLVRESLLMRVLRWMRRNLLNPLRK